MVMLRQLTFLGLGKIAPVVVDTAVRHGVKVVPELLSPVKPDEIPAFLKAHNLDMRYTGDAIFLIVGTQLYSTAESSLFYNRADEQS